jgi:DNA-binding NtrC family response regulator
MIARVHGSDGAKPFIMISAGDSGKSGGIDFVRHEKGAFTGATERHTRKFI